MNKKEVLVDLFVEDAAHEALLKPLIERAGKEAGVVAIVHVRSARGGRGRALEEYRLYQKALEKGALAASQADVIVVGIDGNCSPFTQKTSEILKATRQRFRPRVVAACPDPHIERWYLADPECFAKVVGGRPKKGTRKKCARDYYKELLAKSVIEGGHPPTLGGVEFARDIATAMDWYRAGKNDRSFKAFAGELRAKIRLLRNGALR